MTVTKLTKTELLKLAKTSAYTITGAGGDLSEWISGYTDLLINEGIGSPKNWMTFTGEQMNETFQLTGKNRYKKNTTFLSFSLEGLDTSKLAIFKLRMQDRWFDDICQNNANSEMEASELLCDMYDGDPMDEDNE